MLTLFLESVHNTLAFHFEELNLNIKVLNVLILRDCHI